MKGKQTINIKQHVRRASCYGEKSRAQGNQERGNEDGVGLERTLVGEEICSPVRTFSVGGGNHSQVPNREIGRASCRERV